MIRKFSMFALLSLLLAACTHQHKSTESEKNWEHRTPKAETELPSTNQESETGWVPVGNQVENNMNSPIASANTAEVKPLIQHRVVKDDIYTAAIETHPEVVRYDRYLLVDSEPQDGQKYLLEQMVTINMKGSGLSVESGMWNTLSGTGYTLCSPINQAVSALFRLQLPKVHYKFGPVRLRDALQMLAGEAYELTVNDALRQICYVPRVGDVPTKATPKTVVAADLVVSEGGE